MRARDLAERDVVEARPGTFDDSQPTFEDDVAVGGTDDLFALGSVFDRGVRKTRDNG
jgi:hypothetical protein